MFFVLVSDIPFTQQGNIKVPRELGVLFERNGFGVSGSLTFDYDGERVIIMDSAYTPLKNFRGHEVKSGRGL